MGELSQIIGKNLENFGSTLFESLDWEILHQNVEFNCTRSQHKNTKGKDKHTHGIDILHGYVNPFTRRKEAIITECKNHLWKDFIPSQLNIWVEELVNTIECASVSPDVAPYLKDRILVGGIILYNSSDNQYELDRALKNISQIIVPKRRTPLMLYIADTNRLEQWYSLNQEINRIKSNNKDHNFGIIYPSIGGSNWDRSSVITPSYLFSDYILSTYTKIEETHNGTSKVDIKAIFSFDKVSNDSLIYLCDMINELQLESRSDRKQEIHIYFYPETQDEIGYIKECFAHSVSKEKPSFKLKLLDNRRLSRVSYE